MTDSCFEKKKRSPKESIVCHNRVSKYLNSNEYSAIRNELRSAGTIIEKGNIKDVILKAPGDKNSLNEKYILRWSHNDKEDVLLIKECTKGSKVKAITEKINYETALHIIKRSAKWLCSSISPLIRELGVKITTERIRPDSVVSFERESFMIENRLKITADSGIISCDYNEAKDLDSHNLFVEPVDKNICLLQVNYERIIPDHISSIIGIKTN